jgi:putative addiction module component (TIGR02574 family)
MGQLNERITTMSGQATSALEAIMALPPEERVEVVEQILAHLDAEEERADQTEIDAAWVQESERRYQAYQRGEMKSVPIEEVLDLLKPRNTQ